MSRLLVALCLFISNVVTVANADTGSNPKRVAMVISGYASQGNPALSYDQEELAQSYLTLVGNNIIVDIVFRFDILFLDFSIIVIFTNTITLLSLLLIFHP